MADLPEDQLKPALPFSLCAVDYFGPWLIPNHANLISVVIQIQAIKSPVQNNDI